MPRNLELKVHIEGDRKLTKRFLRLEKKVKVNAIRRGIRRGNKIFREAGRRNVVVHTGRIKKAIKSKVSKKFDVVTGTTFVESGRSAKHDAFYAHMVEFGTKPRYKTRPIFNPKGKPNWIRTDKSGKTVPRFSIGSYQPPVRFMTRAFEDNKDSVVRAFQKELRRTIREALGL